MAPILQSPLALGAGAALCCSCLVSVPACLTSTYLHFCSDICMTSATKFIAGHSDTMAGILSVRGEALGKELYFHANAEGTGLAPFDCWLTLRGLKTMALRMAACQSNAIALAKFLDGHPLVKRLNFRGCLPIQGQRYMRPRLVDRAASYRLKLVIWRSAGLLWRGQSCSRSLCLLVVVPVSSPCRVSCPTRPSPRRSARSGGCLTTSSASPRASRVRSFKASRAFIHTNLCPVQTRRI